MSATKEEFQALLERSNVYEVAFSQWLQNERGYFILPAYAYNADEAPSLICGTRKLVTPDLFGVSASIIAWFEVKVKESADFHRKSNRLVTGLPLRHWNDYVEIKKLMGCPVWIVFIHETENVVVTGEIGNMPHAHTWQGDDMDRGGTIYFVFKQLKTLPVTPEELRQLVEVKP